ncbi:16S rRNA (guanine(966)-N(2))-methyltransferase RsmD [Thermosulfuriphilus ammonigenes]|uniref:16S rRNA (guanine(966)-N(2))-methyltransferase RsmD n=1 Tax=Thermosulfuriphilus ammonigenes TaxID=1936021 RepID=UPI0031B61529
MRLKGPSGERIRPMADRVRKALFDILASRGLLEGSFLDLYAGTGAVGIEALSRGASRVVLVDKDPRALRLIRQNLARTGASAEIIRYDLSRGLPPVRGPFEVISVTPPYGQGLAEKTLGDLAQSGLLAPGGLVVVEERETVTLPSRVGRLTLKDRRRYGQSVLWFYEEER